MLLAGTTGNSTALASIAESDAFSRDLKRRGFTFVGSTVIYAHMQAVGMVNDHFIDCFRYREVRRLGLSAARIQRQRAR
jgi:DNA-3-methyladenine glycosylase I